MSLPPPIRLLGRHGSGAVYEHGGHLVSWTPEGGSPVIWMSALARFDPDTAIRGGVPIVFPWFGAGRSGDLAPAHGFARLRSWTVVESGAGGQQAHAALTLAADSQIDPPFRARYEITMGRSLRLSLRVDNVGDVPFSYEEALHCYLVVGDVREVVIGGLDGCSYLDQVAEGGPSVEMQAGDLILTGETDRIYAVRGVIRVIDPVLGRVLVITRQGSANAVVWNPWDRKASRMADFGDEEWPGMLCVEGGNLREAAVSLQPGESHEMRYEVRLEPLV